MSGSPLLSELPAPAQRASSGRRNPKCRLGYTAKRRDGDSRMTSPSKFIKFKTKILHSGLSQGVKNMMLCCDHEKFGSATVHTSGALKITVRPAELSPTLAE